MLDTPGAPARRVSRQLADVGTIEGLPARAPHRYANHFVRALGPPVVRKSDHAGGPVTPSGIQVSGDSAQRLVYPYGLAWYVRRSPGCGAGWDYTRCYDFSAKVALSRPSWGLW